MQILFGAGHVAGAKIYLGYNEDENMLDLAKREAQYAKDRYGQQTKVFSVTGTSYPTVEEACRGCDLAIFEHSNAEPEPIKGTANRVTIYRTVKNQGDGVCLDIAKVTAKILGTVAYPVQHAKNSKGNDAYGVLGRAMSAGCQDTWLAENGFHTHAETRRLLSSAQIRQQIAEAKVDAMAQHYGWESDSVIKVTSPLTKSDAVYDYQKLVKGMGYNIGVYADMKTGQATGCDGLYGATMETITNQLRKKYGLAQTGIVDADLYGKIALELANKPDDSAKVASLETKVKALQAEVNAKAAIALEASNKIKSIRQAIDTFKLF